VHTYHRKTYLAAFLEAGAEKEFIMKLKRAIALGCFLVGSLSAYAQTGGVKVNVPFSFFVASKSFPAGNYTVSSLRDSVVLWDSRGNRVAMVLSNSIRQEGGDTGKVVFECYIRRCYLSQLRMPDPDRSREVLPGKEQIEIARQEAPKPLVLLGSRAK
jgi:hypothetical protein